MLETLSVDALLMEPPASYTAVSPPDALVTSRIHPVRGQKVILDRDLAELYGVEVKRLKQAVRRNIDRFPEDFIFELTMEEDRALRSQFVTLKQGAHTKYLPFAFTEHGILMLANVLRSEQAIAVSIQIIRVFNRMREVLLSHREILQRQEQLEGRVTGHDDEIQAIFDHLTELVAPAEQMRKPIGFKPNEA
ncbi:MAG TPA: ORF6N domain-containing protein [Flavobacteriales bacterium]|jgi:phage regulator Rha-like protein|nr:ORF6N domain-containing protein [Flavobacteriales bacterium]HQW40888.1 ORF6N domain-containing protein [Flavobacteriales bacterium]